MYLTCDYSDLHVRVNLMLFYTLREFTHAHTCKIRWSHDKSSWKKYPKARCPAAPGSEAESTDGVDRFSESDCDNELAGYLYSDIYV